MPTPPKPLSPAQQVGADIDRAVTFEDLQAAMSRACTLWDVAEGHRLGQEILCRWLKWLATIAGPSHAKAAKLLLHKFDKMPKLYG